MLKLVLVPVPSIVKGREPLNYRRQVNYQEDRLFHPSAALSELEEELMCTKKEQTTNQPITTVTTLLMNVEPLGNHELVLVTTRNSFVESNGPILYESGKISGCDSAGSSLWSL